MTKEKIVQELDTYVKNIDSLFSVDDEDDDLNLKFDDDLICYLLDFKIKHFSMCSCTEKESLIVVKYNIIKKFYDKAVDVIRKNENKYTVQLIENDKGSFLNYIVKNGYYCFSSRIEYDGYKTRFTESEIEALKERDDIAIDWDKAIIKEV